MKSVILVCFALACFQFYLAAADTTLPSIPPPDNACLGCICEAISDCNRTTQCDGDTCGLFKITQPYWVDAGRPTVGNEDPKSPHAYVNCTLNEVCAGTTVSQYLTRFAQDCNEDGKIDCYDYAAIHLRGGYGGCRANPLNGQYLKRFTTCQKHLESLGASPTGTQVV